MGQGGEVANIRSIILYYVTSMGPAHWDSETVLAMPWGSSTMKWDFLFFIVESSLGSGRQEVITLTLLLALCVDKHPREGRLRQTGAGLPASRPIYGGAVNTDQHKRWPGKRKETLQENYI